MYQQIFRRDEKKYLLNHQQKSELMARIASHIEPDDFPSSTICSLYFDTPTQDLIIASISKPVYKTKIRLRSYGVPKLDDEVFLEVKNKFRGIVSKRRFKIKLSDFYNYYEKLKSNPAKAVLKSSDHPQIAKELDYLFHFYHLQPNWLVCYDRKSYRGRADPSLRLTFDQDLRSRRDDLRLETGDQGTLYFQEKHKQNRVIKSPNKNSKNDQNPEFSILEIKSLDAMPLWLVHALSELKIYPVSFTKYGNIYKQSKKGVLC